MRPWNSPHWLNGASQMASPRPIKLSYNCPDRADMCKHVAALPAKRWGNFTFFTLETTATKETSHAAIADADRYGRVQR